MDLGFTIILGMVFCTAIVWAHVALFKRWKKLSSPEKVMTVLSATWFLESSSDVQGWPYFNIFI